MVKARIDDSDVQLKAGDVPTYYGRPLAIAVVVFISLMLLSVFFISSIERRVDDISKQKTLEFSRNYATIFELNLQRSLSAAIILGGFIEDQNGDMKNFERQAQIIYFSLGGISNLQLAPDAIVQKIFPFRDGDEKAIGHNLIADDARRIEADLAIRTRSMTVAGPFKLVQGGTAIVGRYPVFVPIDSPFLTFGNSAPLDYGLQGNHRFWGYSTVLIDFERMLELSGLQQLPAQGYGYNLWRIHPDTGEVAVISASSEPLSDEKISREIQLPNAVWMLEIEQLRDLGNTYTGLIRWITATLISMVSAILMYFLTLWPERIRQIVRIRTNELQAATGHLETITSQYESILDSAAEGIYGVDSGGNVIFANPAALVAFGGLSNDIVGHSQYAKILRVAVDGSIYNRNDCSIQRSIVVGKQVHVQHALFCKVDGTQFSVEYTCSPVSKGDQELAAVIVFRDTSERALLEAELRLTSYAFDTSNAILIADKSGRILRANEAFTTMTGFVISDIKDKKFDFFTYVQEQSTNYVQISDHVNKSGTWTGEIVAERKNKKQFTCIATINRVVDPNGEISNYVMHVQDITYRKEAEQELKEQKNKAEAANKSKSEFLAMMSHEIRTPLSGVMGLLDLLSRTSIDEKQKQYIETAKDSGDALLTVINDVLDFSKMEADKLELEESVFDPVPLINSVSLLMAPRAQAKGLVFLTETSGDMPEIIKGDPGRMRQILLNLVSNAIKFTTSGSVILRMTSSADGVGFVSLVFEVIDSGIGISEENKKHLFQKFSTVDASYSRRFGGTGLGLSISHQLVTLMNGKIGVDSTIEKGSRFWFKVRMPIAVKQESMFAVKQINHHSKTTKQGLILVAEDVMANRLVIKEVLERAGHVVHLVENGLEAVQAVKLTAFDAILMDVSMPEMDGLQATRAIRGLSGETNKVPIIAMTAHALKGDREHFIASGMDDYLTKPIQTTELMATLANWIDNQPSLVADSSAKKDEDKTDTTVIPTTAGSDNMIDIAVLEQMAEDTSRELVPTLAGIFIEDSRSRLMSMSMALEKADWPNIGLHAHSLTGSGMAYGLSQMAVLARAVEYAIKDSEMGEAEKHVHTLLSQAPEHLSTLEHYLDEWS